MTPIAPPPAVILAGGKARRLGGGDKGLLLVGGRSIMAHVIDRLALQCGTLAINANGDPGRFGAFCLPVLPDTVPGQPGPLAGVLAAMDWAAAAGADAVLTVAADLPFLPHDLVARLRAAAAGDIAMAASAVADGALHPHPTTALWPVALRHDLRRVLDDGMRRMTDFTTRHHARMVTFDGGPSEPFFNVNTPADLQKAQDLMQPPPLFDRIAILDWSARGAPSPKRESRDAIWIGVTDAPGGVEARYHRTRHAAMADLGALAACAVAEGSRLLIGADFAFGYPAGFATRIVGAPDTLALWRHFAATLSDAPDNANSHRALAAGMNRSFGGSGPFWGNGSAAEVANLPRTRPPLPEGMQAHRLTERAAWAHGAQPKSVWQLAGAGVVGAQALTGIPAMAGLHARLAPHVAVWPFEPHDAAPVVLAEVYPSLIAAAVRDLGSASGDTIPDRVQVRLLAATLAHLASTGALGALFSPDAPDLTLREEGWILGVGFEPALQAAAQACIHRLAQG